AGPRPAALPIPPLLDLQRLAAARGLSLHPAPKHRPVNSGLADRVVIALVEAGHDPRYFVGKVLSGAWAHDDGVGDPAVLSSYLSQVGLDAMPALKDAKTEEVAAIRERNSREALAAGAVAVPAYVLGGEAFIGQDRIEMLEEVLRTGRKAFPH
ncbi:DsbA family protein, partial [Hoeflea sp. BAL378]|uniref:DsbA family protein n=1 Tax=Hoeflea sp. BAL378 TaxID=1547437 RepID=UPI00068E743E